MSTYSQALAVAVNGFSVIPLKKDKRPLLASWKQYQEKPASDEQIELWWTEHPDANVGVVTGKVSGVTVVDIDTYKGGDISKFPETYTVRTGNGGYHLYYIYEAGLTISANAYAHLPGVDIRNDGGFVVAPPSVTSYEKDGKLAGGAYTIEKNIPFAPFPAHLFPKARKRRTLTERIGATAGNRNDTIASVIGTLLHSLEEKAWTTDGWVAIQRINKTYTPPLPLEELKNTFESIMKKEKARREELVLSPIQTTDGKSVAIPIRKSRNGVAYKDMANVLAVLENHPLYKGSLRYNEFRQEIEYNGVPIDDTVLVQIQYFMQTQAELHGISKDAVLAAIIHYAATNKYDEAKDWLLTQEWDGTPRLADWLHNATGVENDDYHQGIGAQWFSGLVRRIVDPGCIFDYVLVLVGSQGIGKTSLFRILGGKWYKSYTGAIDNKDFYLALRGAVIVDLDEGAALSKSEAIKIKSIITQTHDEFRAPYDRLMRKSPRRFVFSMSTNDTEPFRDLTGNRRYWTVDAPGQINFKWLEENRDQLYAEAYHCLKNKIALPEVPFAKAAEHQEAHLLADSWIEPIVEAVHDSILYCKGSEEYFLTIPELYKVVFPGEGLLRLGKREEMRVANILKKELGLEKKQRRVDGKKRNGWVLTKKKAKELQEKEITHDPDKF